jgi:hypothetical protein
VKLVAHGAMVCLLVAGFCGFLPGVSVAQQGATAPANAPQRLGQAQLDQLVAPIALYPDPLLAQILMAATYPLEVVEAARWADAHKGLSGDPLTQALASETWDESVKALVATPTVLAMLSQKLDWTQSLGDAVAAQQPDVMAAVQRLRQRAEAHGTLKSTKQQTVTVSSDAAPAIEIMPAEPEVIYVPYYEPAVVYGAWPYAGYPPYFFPAPFGYVAGPALWFGAGVALGFGWDHLGNVGRFNWHDGNIYVHGNVNAHWYGNNVNVHVNVNNNNNNNHNNNNNDDHSNNNNSHNNDNNNDHGYDDADRQDDHASDRTDDNFGRGDENFDRGGGGGRR